MKFYLPTIDFHGVSFREGNEIAKETKQYVTKSAFDFLLWFVDIFSQIEEIIFMESTIAWGLIYSQSISTGWTAWENFTK